MAKPTSRVLALLELLQSGGTRTVAELADRLEVDERTVRRYVEHLLELDVPVESVRGRYGGYRLMPGFRMPPLVLTDDEALAVLLGLATTRSASSGPAAETAAAKIRRVLPAHLARRVDDVLGAIDRTEEPGSGPEVPDGAVLLPLADAVRHHRPVAIGYTDRHGRRTDRTLHPQGLVVHNGRWYVTGRDVGAGDGRTFRLDRIARVRTLPGSFEPEAGFDAAEHVLDGFATAGYRHEVVLRIQASPRHLRDHLPRSVAVIDETGDWQRVTIRAESLDWIPGVLARLDRPFTIERPAELEQRVLALAQRLSASVTG